MLRVRARGRIRWSILDSSTENHSCGKDMVAKQLYVLKQQFSHHPRNNGSIRTIWYRVRLKHGVIRSEASVSLSRTLTVSILESSD